MIGPYRPARSTYECPLHMRIHVCVCAMFLKLSKTFPKNRPSTTQVAVTSHQNNIVDLNSELVDHESAATRSTDVSETAFGHASLCLVEFSKLSSQGNLLGNSHESNVTIGRLTRWKVDPSADTSYVYFANFLTRSVESRQICSVMVGRRGHLPDLSLSDHC